MLESHSLDLNPASVITSQGTGAISPSPDVASGLLTGPTPQTEKNQAETTARGESTSLVYTGDSYITSK